MTKAAAINEFWNSFGLKTFEENTLLDVDENGQEVSPGDVGELIVKGPVIIFVKLMFSLPWDMMMFSPQISLSSNPSLIFMTCFYLRLLIYLQR